MKMLGGFLLLNVCVFAFASGQAVLPNPLIHRLALQGIDLMWEQKYDAADSIFHSIMRQFPDDPAGYVFDAGVLQARAIDHEELLNLEVFDSLAGMGKEKAEALTSGKQDAKWGYFFKGTADGYDSYARVYRGDWFGGTRKALASVSALKDAIALDSSMDDAYAGVGAFSYWRSRKTEYFNWIPFVGDDRPESYALLLKTADHGIYNRYTALTMLGDMYIDAGLFDKARDAATRGLARFPSNRTFLWLLATSLHKLGDLPEAAQAYQRLLRSISDDKESNEYNRMVCLLNLATVKLAQKDTADVRTSLTTILNHRPGDFPAHLRARFQDNLEQAQRLMKKLANGQPANE